MSTRKLPRDAAAAAKSWLAGQGFTSDILENIGAFVTLWAAFENRVEQVIWSFEGRPAPHTRPSTDSQPLTKWWETLEKIAESLGPDLRPLLHDFVVAGRDLAAYRHAMLHGWVIPKGIGGPMFLSNARWGDLHRKRASQDAHVHPDMANLAISAVVDLLQVAGAFIAREPGGKVREGAAVETRRARSAANEVRHITALMNHEKY